MMIKGLGRRGMRMLLIATAMLAGAAGIALATIPGSDGVINGCYEKRTGILRVIDAQAGKKCLSLETPIGWNQQGPKGDQGLQGTPGAKGEKGDKGDQGLQGEPGRAGPASLEQLAGTPCTLPDGTVSTVSVAVAGDGLISLRCEAAGGDGSGGGADEFEENDTRETAAVLSAGAGVYQGRLTAEIDAGDDDWYATLVGCTDAFNSCVLSVGITGALMDVYLDGVRMAEGVTQIAPQSLPALSRLQMEIRVHGASAGMYVLTVGSD